MTEQHTNLLDLLQQLDIKINQVNKVNGELKDVIKQILDNVSTSNEGKSRQDKLMELMINKFTLNLDNKQNGINGHASNNASTLSQTPTTQLKRDIVRFNVGGKIFSTTKYNVCKQIRKLNDPTQNYEPNFLEGLVNGILDSKHDNEHNAIFIDRNPKYFHYLLDYLRMADSDEEFELPRNEAELKNLYKEAEYFNLQGIIDLINSFPPSFILTPMEFDRLNDLIGFERGSKWKMIYRASTDGFGCDKFHAKCDNIHKTLVLVITNHSYIFGGYTSVCWDQSGEYKDDKNAFLFSFINPDGRPVKLNYNGSGKAIYCHANNSATFGGGHDLFLATHANTSKNSHSNLGHSFKHPSYKYESDHIQSFLAGSYNFQVNDIEVFHLVN